MYQEVEPTAAKFWPCIYQTGTYIVSAQVAAPTLEVQTDRRDLFA